MRILGLDMSSTCIGHAVCVGAVVERFGHRDLDGDIARRCADAAAHVGGLLDIYRPALVVIESPVARYAKAVIPQARVSGAVLAVLSGRAALWHEATPQAGKTALTGRGNADKAAMVRYAAAQLGHASADVAVRRGKTVALALRGDVLLTEDEADAIGMALAGLSVQVVMIN